VTRSIPDGLKSLLPNELRESLRRRYFRWKGSFVQAFLSYDTTRLERSLRGLGLSEGDTVLVHGAFHPHGGFKGSPGDLIEVILKVLGPGGNLLMVSMPYRTSSYEYVRSLDVFDVRRTVSKMGLVSEVFRRRAGVLRSLNPVHPVLALGPKAEWIVSGHELCEHSCGEGSPFQKLAELNGKVLFYDVPFNTFTFIHRLEHLLRDDLPFPLYREEPFEAPVIDREGRPLSVKCYVFTEQAVRRRRPEILEKELKKKGLLGVARVGNTRFLMVETSRAIECAMGMARAGVYFYRGE
jgi:aminoglycoside 3-N-acetyltransferase